jgi:hypothetical protein
VIAGPPAHQIEILTMRLIPNQVVAPHIAERVGQALIEVIAVVNEKAARSARQHCETGLRIAI